MKNKKIAVLMGGPSIEREVSLKTGKAILSALHVKGYNAVPIELEPAQLIEQLKAEKIDVVFNAIHGRFGEDGVLQGVLTMLGIPFTGSGVLASAVAMDKAISKQIFKAAGVPTPRAIYYHDTDNIAAVIADIKSQFRFPLVIKASAQGSSIGVYIVYRESDIESSLVAAFELNDRVIAEEFIDGRELTVALLGKETMSAMPIIEIVPRTGRYDYQAKYTKGYTDYLVPAQLDNITTLLVKRTAAAAATALRCRGIARVDMMLDKQGNVYVLEVNTMPGMTATSLVPKAADAMGMDFSELCEKILLSAGSD